MKVEPCFGEKYCFHLKGGCILTISHQSNMKQAASSVSAACCILISRLAYSSALMIGATYSSKRQWTFSGLHGVLFQKIEVFITNIVRNSNRTNNKKFWEELIAYFSFTVILVSDTANRKKTLLYMRNEVSKTIPFVRLNCWYYWWSWCRRYTVEMALDGMIYIPSFIKICSSIQNIKVIVSTVWEVEVLVLLMRWPQMAWYIQRVS
jgi:hypothetical protein